MKARIESLKSAAATPAVRGVGATAVLAPLTSVLGSLTFNHNETLLHEDRASAAERDESGFREKIDSVAVRSVGAIAVLAPVAALVGGMNLGNHNETFLSDRPA